MKALITGGTGFIGSHMSELLLSQGHDVLCLVRDQSELRHLQGVPVRTILRQGLKNDIEERGPVDLVIHMAGATRATDYESYRTSNVEFTANLLEFFSQKGEARQLKRFVLVSSQAAAGPCRSGYTPVVEDEPGNPVSMYGESKLEAERVAISYSTQMPITIVRPPTVFGPRDRDVLGVFQSARFRVVPYLSGPDRLVSIIYVEDLIRGILVAALAPEAVGETYFLANPEPVVWREFAQRVTGIMGYRSLSIPVPLGLMRMVAKFGDFMGKVTGSARLFRTEKLDEMAQIAWICSTEKALRDLMWQADTPLDQAVAKTAAWYRAHRWI